MKKKLFWLIAIAVVIVDRVTKELAPGIPAEGIGIIPGVVGLRYAENKGMAFGMSFGGVIGKYALTAFRIVLFTVLTIWISRLVKREKPVPTGVLVGLTLITAGALGNIIDCLFYGLIFTESAPGVVATLGHYAPFMQGRVVDMFYFPLWTWPDWVPLVGGDIFFEPVFNFADSCVTVGAIYLILFQWKFFSKED